MNIHADYIVINGNTEMLNSETYPSKTIRA